MDNIQQTQQTQPTQPKFKLTKKQLIIFGIVLFIFIILATLLGVITKNVKNIITPKVNPSPTPQDTIIDPNNVSTVSGELSGERIKLTELKDQINNLDVNQSRLKPPAVNFKIDFEAKK